MEEGGRERVGVIERVGGGKGERRGNSKGRGWGKGRGVGGGKVEEILMFERQENISNVWRYGRNMNVWGTGEFLKRSLWFYVVCALI